MFKSRGSKQKIREIVTNNRLKNYHNAFETFTRNLNASILDETEHDELAQAFDELTTFNDSAHFEIHYSNLLSLVSDDVNCLKEDFLFQLLNIVPLIEHVNEKFISNFESLTGNKYKLLPITIELVFKIHKKHYSLATRLLNEKNYHFAITVFQWSIHVIEDYLCAIAKHEKIDKQVQSISHCFDNRYGLYYVSAMIMIYHCHLRLGNTEQIQINLEYIQKKLNQVDKRSVESKKLVTLLEWANKNNQDATEVRKPEDSLFTMNNENIYHELATLYFLDKILNPENYLDSKTENSSRFRLIERLQSLYKKLTKLKKTVEATRILAMIEKNTEILNSHESAASFCKNVSEFIEKAKGGKASSKNSSKKKKVKNITLATDAASPVEEPLPTVSITQAFPFLINLIEAFEKHNKSIYLVGGAPLHILLNNTYISNIDFAIDATMDEIWQIWPIGKFINGKRPVFVFSFGSITIKLVSILNNLEQDYLGRNFTINGLYIEPITGKIIHGAEGIKDIYARTLRSIREPYQLFEENPPEILRAIRHKAELGLKFDPPLEKAFTAQLKKVDTIYPAAVYYEVLHKALCMPFAYQYLKLLNQYNLFKVIYPFIEIFPSAVKANFNQDLSTLLVSFSNTTVVDQQQNLSSLLTLLLTYPLYSLVKYNQKMDLSAVIGDWRSVRISVNDYALFWNAINNRIMYQQSMMTESVVQYNSGLFGPS